MKGHPSPKQLATYLRALAKKLDHSGGLALDRAELLAARGWPASTSGNGSRSSDTTSSTERAATVGAPNDPANGQTWRPGEYDDADKRLAANFSKAHLAALDLEAGVDTILATAPTVDQLPPGTGYCVCACERYCSPRQNGSEDRLRSGLAPACYRRFARWRDDDPIRTVADYCTLVRRTRTKVAEKEAELARLRAELRV